MFTWDTSDKGRCNEDDVDEDDYNDDDDDDDDADTVQKKQIRTNIYKEPYVCLTEIKSACDCDRNHEWLHNTYNLTCH